MRVRLALVVTVGLIELALLVVALVTSLVNGAVADVRVSGHFGEVTDCADKRTVELGVRSYFGLYFFSRVVFKLYVATWCRLVLMTS